MVATSTPDVGPPLPQQQRLLAHAWALAAEIGPRPAGSGGEASGVAYLKRQLQSFGYEVILQPFPFSSEVYRATSFRLLPGGEAIPNLAASGSASGTVTGRLVDAGDGRPDDIAGSRLAGAIALVRANERPVSAVAAGVQAAGAAALVLVSSTNGRPEATLDQPAAIPVIAIGKNDGDSLRTRLQASVASARIEVGGNQGTATNVIARPPGRGCETVTGAHFDSVPQSRGANDNASGAAVVLELARAVVAARIPGDNCFVFFSGEEFGLLGSRAYLRSLTPGERSRLRLMVNFDMSGVGDRWLLLGSPDAVARAQEAAAGAGIAAEPGEMPGRTSDFASFLAEGVPAVLVFDSDDPRLHTPDDTFDRLQPQDLQEAARIGIALLRLVNAPAAGPTPGTE